MTGTQLKNYLDKLGASDYEIDLLSISLYDFGPHSLSLWRRSNGSHKILGYAQPGDIDRLRDMLNRHIDEMFPGGLQKSPYYYYHTVIGKSK